MLKRDTLMVPLPIHEIAHEFDRLSRRHARREARWKACHDEAVSERDKIAADCRALETERNRLMDTIDRLERELASRGQSLSFRMRAYDLRLTWEEIRSDGPGVRRTMHALAVAHVPTSPNESVVVNELNEWTEDGLVEKPLYDMPQVQRALIFEACREAERKRGART